MLNIFREVLERYNFPYKFISGNIETRIKASIKVIDKLFLVNRFFLHPFICIFGK